MPVHQQKSPRKKVNSLQRLDSVSHWKPIRAHAELASTAVAATRQVRLRITEVEHMFDTPFKSIFPKKCDPAVSRLYESMSNFVLNTEFYWIVGLHLHHSLSTVPHLVGILGSPGEASQKCPRLLLGLCWL